MRSNFQELTWSCTADWSDIPFVLSSWGGKMTSLNVWTVWVGPGWACLLPPGWSFWSDLNVLLIRTDLLSQDSGSSIKWSFIKLSLMTFFLFSLSFWTNLDLLLSWRPVLSLLIVTCCYCAGTVERLVWAQTIKEWREAADNRLQNCRTAGQCWLRVGWRGHEEGEDLCWEYPEVQCGETQQSYQDQATAESRPRPFQLSEGQDHSILDRNWWAAALAGPWACHQTVNLTQLTRDIHWPHLFLRSSKLTIILALLLIYRVTVFTGYF